MVCTIIDADVQYKVHLVAILSQFDTYCLDTAMIGQKKLNRVAVIAHLTSATLISSPRTTTGSEMSERLTLEM